MDKPLIDYRKAMNCIFYTSNSIFGTFCWRVYFISRSSSCT